MMDPHVLLLDEVTASLDPEMVREVLDVIIDLAHDGMTMLLVTHEMAFARAIADRVIFMDHGRIKEVARAEKFFTDPGSQRARQFLDTFIFQGKIRRKAEECTRRYQQPSFDILTNPMLYVSD